MIWRTHLAITLLFVLIFIPHINYPIIFSIVALLACLLVDIDTYYSYVGNVVLLRPLQFFTKHRGMIHSLTLAILLSILIALVSPEIALPFFLGYGLHVFVDSFTVDGIRPFWPYKGESKGLARTGAGFENIIFVVFLLLDLLVAYFLLL